jgi:penicillin-binding protein 1A
VVRDFFKVALADSPPIPFRAPPGIKLVRVNLKTGLPAGPNDPKAIMEAFKPSQEPTGLVPDAGDGSDQAQAGDFGQAAPGEPGPAPILPQAPGPPPGPFPTPGNDRALTSGTGGLY